MDRRLYLKFFKKATRERLIIHSAGKTVTDDHIDYKGDYDFLLDMTKLGAYEHRRGYYPDNKDKKYHRTQLGHVTLLLTRFSQEKGAPERLMHIVKELETVRAEDFQ